MKKIYYNKDGWVCDRYPYNLPIEDDNMYIEVDKQTYNNTLYTKAGKAWRVVDGVLTNQIYDEKIYNNVLYKCQLEDFKNWFNNYYTIQEQKLRRLHTVGKMTDDGQDPYQALIKLYNQAEINRAKIQELEALIG